MSIWSQQEAEVNYQHRKKMTWVDPKKAYQRYKKAFLKKHENEPDDSIVWCGLLSEEDFINANYDDPEAEEYYKELLGS